MARHGSPSTSDNRYASGAAVRACIGECVATGLFSLISLMCYQQLAAPHCAGQPHTLPPDSAVLNGYPCDGSAITRMLYILRHSPMVLWDICWVKFEDVWAATGLLMIYVRFFAAILVPDPFYGQVLAPFTVYYARFVNTAFHVFQGPRYKPSYLGLQSLFSKHAPFEVAFFLSLLGVWRVNMVIELAYCAWAAAATAILWYWYRDFIPGVSFQGQMLTRLIVTLTNIYLDRLLSCRRHQHRGPAGLGRGSGPAARATAATTAAATAAATTAACGSAGSVMCKDAAAAAAIAIKEGAECVGGKEKDAVLKTKFPSSDDSSSAEAVSRPDGILPPAGHVFLRHSKPSAAAPVINSSNSSRGGGDTGSDGNGNSNAGGNGNGSCITSTALSEKEETTSTCWRTAPARVTQASGDVTAAVATPSAPSAGSQDGRMATMVPPTAYRSPCRRRTVLVKIPWAEPEQMTPRFEQRLKALVSEQGLKLTGVYVRRGCVELLMVVEEEVDPPPPPPLALALPAGAGSQSGNTGAWHLDPAALLEALGLAPRESETEWQGPTNGDGAGDGGDGSSSVSSSGCCSGAWAAQQQLLQLITQEDSALLTREAAMQRAAEEVDAATDYIIVTGLEPRVVLMTSSPTPVAAAASSGVPALRLSVAVSRRPPEKQRKQQKQKQQAEEEEAGKVVNQEMGEAEVLVRTANTHLPVRVTTQKMQCRRVGSGSAPVSSKWPFGHEYEYEYEFDIELLDAPPRPGVVLVRDGGWCVCMCVCAKGVKRYWY
ncbi:hypothetical protein Vafri_19210 [Volvox africanus]|uniref:Uncharacterized protein n=2 Tax=Volvox africanus TaxID=51714 RepID=A0A8J4F8I6_9CHLO|nr:hypothetical protein Vafri_19210 [Volvox africanus]